MFCNKIEINRLLTDGHDWRAVADKELNAVYVGFSTYKHQFELRRTNGFGIEKEAEFEICDPWWGGKGKVITIYPKDKSPALFVHVPYYKDLLENNFDPTQRVHFFWFNNQTHEYEQFYAAARTQTASKLSTAVLGLIAGIALSALAFYSFKLYKR